MSKILSIPKYRLPFNNGYSRVKDTDVWLQYGSYMLYRDLSENFKLFYKVIPYLIIRHQDRYLVFEDNGLSFNPKGLSYIIEGMAEYDPIKAVVQYNAKRYGVKDMTTLVHEGYIKSIKEYPNAIAVIYIAEMGDRRRIPKNAKLLTVEELINKNRKFDSFGMYYIDYIVKKEYKG